MKLLVTGLSGLIGGAAHPVLSVDHDLEALNRRAVDGVRTWQADIADYDAIRPAFEGKDAVVHLAAKPGEQFGWEALRVANVEGTRNVFQAAVDAGVTRVVFASSGATVAGWEHDEPYRALVEGRYAGLPAGWPMITVDMPARPRGVYGSTKVWGEALARHFADTTGTSFVSVRIGFVNAEDRPTNARQRSVWCSQRDVVNALVASLGASQDLGCGTFFANSRNRYGYRDLDHGRELVGFEPLDAADER
ncbi:MAG: NAD-dependent epimerase/dehydratase family protein [Pseudomonadales bacterium]|nr:NAD(P)-dependent oxidoreductase [Pseudomonadales bacterium]NIX09162.1 NAD-dependent epimerase/dehydratase family protein [Pseudomonadales bacterium]